MEAAMWWWDGPWSMPWMFGPFMMIIFMVLCGAMMFFMMRGMMGGHRGRFDDRVALNILKERFARGEISRTEYEEQRRLLEV
jgi:putative membrane protein